MKKVMFSTSAIFVCLIVFLTMSSFNMVKKEASKFGTLKVLNGKRQAVTFHTVATGGEGSNFTGTVTASGGINATGTYTMAIEVHGMALHCDLILTLPNGSITIRELCNMNTNNGQWKITDGTGAYTELKGNGSLVMPDDIQEILTGDIKW